MNEFHFIWVGVVNLFCLFNGVPLKNKRETLPSDRLWFSRQTHLWRKDGSNDSKQQQEKQNQNIFHIELYKIRVYFNQSRVVGCWSTIKSILVFYLASDEFK